MDLRNQKPLKIHLVCSTDSPEFTHLTESLTRSSLIALDAEWKPVHTGPQSYFPTVTLLQLACELSPLLVSDPDELEDSATFLVDLTSIPLSSIWELLRDVFVSPDILKLGFRFKQDLIYLSSTFCEQGCDPGFDRVEPFLDITSVYNHLQHKLHGRKVSKQIKSLATICKELLGLSLSKELQCSDWSRRPLTEEQKTYAAMDAHCLLKIFNVFHAKTIKEGSYFHNVDKMSPANVDLGLKEVLEQHDISMHEMVSRSSSRITMPMDESILNVVKKYGEKILLKDSDRKPKASKKRGKRQSPVDAIFKEKQSENSDAWQGPPPWDLSLGGDGCPKFLCDVMVLMLLTDQLSVEQSFLHYHHHVFFSVEGLAKHLRCVGIDAAIPYTKKPEPRELIEQALKENRVLLTRDAKLLRHEYLIKNQIYRVKALLKNKQLLEVIETFQLKIIEDQLMSRCTKCNGRFIQKPLSTEEAVEAAKGFQRIPNCLFNKNLEFWQCMDCRQLYWEGTQYHNAVQKFIDVCKLND
ncbi:hypothetical protein F2P56_035326 [Juglans regia]|uniref:3'-5' exonuclease domain-containing protein n=1 Tax=Juglans regia TaxID=51240 RepID=A0A833T9C9_JUGRE|nr:hypothetical protein F2P56_035326 [Juglans regia]